jgi:pSer/pThr/pTyr-binding forkhead associated (FHA) protein
VWIDVPGVSRRHARLTVPPDARDPHAVIEDLGSTNGTFARGQRTTGTDVVRDGDAIRLGRVSLVFRVWNGADEPTKRVR